MCILNYQSLFSSPTDALYICIVGKDKDHTATGRGGPRGSG